MNRFGYSLGWTALSAIACGGVPASEEGDVSAERTGSIVTSLAPHGLAGSELVSRCGDGTATEAGLSKLRRLPFVQQVSSSSAVIVFRTTEPSRWRSS